MRIKTRSVCNVLVIALRLRVAYNLSANFEDIYEKIPRVTRITFQLQLPFFCKPG